MRRPLVFATFLLAGSAACGWFAGIDDLEIGECKGGPCPDSAANPPPPSSLDGAPLPGPDGEAPCPGQGTPAARVGGFCIDTLEVTRARYREFLAAAVDPRGQPAVCAWNESFAPDEVDAGEDVPITGIDWCDAVAYCTWAGKYLCGRFENGAKTGPVSLDGLADFRTSQWMFACSEEGRRAYSYGGIFDPTKCNMAELEAGALVPAGSLPDCVGGFPGIFDLIGNAWEWYDGPCIADGSLEVDGGDGGPASDDCRIKGGGFPNPGADVGCGFDARGIRRDLRAPWLGFRCCSD